MSQVANWGCGKESVLDAVSLAEQYACSKTLNESGAWHLFFRKDLFAPTENISIDKVATNLIYHQIVGGIRAEEYICEVRTKREKDVRVLIADMNTIRIPPFLFWLRLSQMFSKRFFVLFITRRRLPIAGRQPYYSARMRRRFTSNIFFSREDIRHNAPTAAQLVRTTNRFEIAGEL